MNAQQDDTGADKPHEPTPRRLEEARKKGQIARSQDVTTAAAYLGLLLALVIFGPESVRRLGTIGMVLIDQPDQLAELFFGASAAPMGGLMAGILLALAPWLLLPAIAAMLAIAAQQSFVVTGENLKPKLSRISPLSIAGQKFGRSGLFEFAKSAVKLCVISLVLGFFLTLEAEVILGLLHLSPGMVTAELGRLLAGFLAVVLAVTAIIAGIDYFWQYFEHIRRNRMSHKELIDETKESEGDPHMKHERRRRGMDIATNRMLSDVPKADVVIVNPLHYAVALKWSRKKGAAPVCLAKGVDEVAARIREAAVEAAVPIHRDPPTARALYATVEIGAEIRPDHYRAVAAAIRFAERMRARARGRR